MGAWFAVIVESAEQAPREQPLRYPGTWPADSTLVLADAEWPIEAVAGKPVGEYVVHRPTGAATLDDALAELGAAPIAERSPVLAIGSNASGAQLRHKARAGGFRLVIPQVLAQITGLSITYASFFTAFGYVPATYTLAPGARRRLFVQFLDARELAAVDASEKPHYDRVPLWPGDVEVRLPSGEPLPRVTAYLAEGGYLAVDGRPLPLGTQREILDLIRTASPELTELLGPSAETAAERARHHARAFRLEVTEAMIRAGLVAPRLMAGLGGRP